MPEREYAVGFNINLRDGRLLHVMPGKQDVPDEVANSPIAQFNEVNPPKEAIAGYVPPYGMPGHNQHHFLTNRGASADEIPTAEYARMAQLHAGAADRVGLVEDRSAPVPEGTIADGNTPNVGANLTGAQMKSAAGDTTEQSADEHAKQANAATQQNEATERARVKREADARAQVEQQATDARVKAESERAKAAQEQSDAKAKEDAAVKDAKAKEEAEVKAKQEADETRFRKR